MDNNIIKLLDKIEFTKDNYNYFSDAKLKKIKVFSTLNTWNIIISKETLLPVSVLEELYTKINKLDKKVSNIDIIFCDTNKDIDTYLSYYPLILKLCKIKLPNKYLDNMQIKDNKLVLIANNIVEEKKLLKILPNLEEIYKDLDYEHTINIKLEEKDDIKEAIKKDLIVGEKEIPKKKTTTKKTVNSSSKDSNVILGRSIREDSIKINTILGEDNNVIVTGKIFGIDNFESTKTDFKVITLSITDFTDSIYCKIFVRDDDEYKRLSKELASGWIKVRGYTKDDPFSRELVLNARDIMRVEVEETKREDTSKEKRVELHTHTKMSQMDGVVDEVTLVKQAIDFGHKAIAITDHNGVQAFPHVFDYVTKYNKDKEDKDKFKAIYGLEIAMIDDKVNIVTRPNKNIMLDEEFVVFDLETTGFNAGGGDSIIEIGAVKIKNGKVIDRYDKLINPGRPLPKKITDLTNITDDMLKDKDNEETSVKDFIKWYGNDPMVAHNAKFDVSFIEMAHKKYNLGEFKNTVIDTLELSRALDPNYSRHSLTALAKRYDILKTDKNPDGFWDEESHHRGDYDAEGTALIFNKMLKKLSDRNIEKMTDLDKLISSDEMYKFGRSHHINLLVKNKTGLKNLFKIVSLASTTYLYKTPRIPRSVLEEYREGLLVGSGCYESEVFTEAKSKSEDELSNIIRFYDYVEVQPLDCYTHLIETNEFASPIELTAHLEKIIRVTEECGKIIVATGNVHELNKEDKIYREIIINQKVPGGGRHPLARNGITKIPDEYFRTTDEMLSAFNFLSPEEAKKIVIDNTNKIADMCDIVEVIIDTGGIPFSPRVKAEDGTYVDCPKEVTKLVYEKAKEWYGEPLPYMLEERIATELYGDIVYKTISKNEKNKEKAHELLHNNIIKGKDNIISLLKKELKTPDMSEEDLEKEVKKSLGGVIGGGFDPIYLIAERLVKHSNSEGYIVGSRGSVGSSFVATLMGITEVNPLPAHYRCPKCKKSIFTDDEGNELASNYSSGFDLPDKVCPDCGEKMIKDGQDMPFATFLGFNADKVPDIDLNFSDLNQASAHAYTKVLFGENNVFKAGTVGTVADKTAFGFVRGYLEAKNIDNMRNAEIERLAAGITGIKRTTGQHPGGIVVIPDYMEVSDFTPYQYPADDDTAAWRTTHFDYHSIDQCLLKLDILGHSDPTQLRQISMQSNTDPRKVPLDDKDTMSIFTSTKVLGVTNEEIMCPTGTLGIPEFGTGFTIGMVNETKPTTFAELVKIAGLSHGTDVWLGNAQELIKNKTVTFKETIGCRDDIMVYLMQHGVKPLKAFKIMEFVRKGKASKDPDTWQEHVKTMEEANIPEWYIKSCQKIKYMFPKAHATAYVMSAFRIAWYKVHMPVYFYSSWLTTKATDIDVEPMIAGYKEIKRRLEDIETKGFEATNKEAGEQESLKVALEATARGIKFLPIDLYESEATVWKVKSDTEIYPPFSSIPGLGDTVAKKIVEERKKKAFISKEDLQTRGKVSGTLIEKMSDMDILKDLPDSNQLSLF
ncbi:MAG: PolC-type DNA polymerase III [Bacilli bacterium]|nr:PolC-type DNA polymerase III [Bacilli bacterium]